MLIIGTSSLSLPFLSAASCSNRICFFATLLLDFMFQYKATRRNHFSPKFFSSSRDSLIHFSLHSPPTLCCCWLPPDEWKARTTVLCSGPNWFSHSLVSLCRNKRKCGIRSRREKIIKWEKERLPMRSVMKHLKSITATFFDERASASLLLGYAVVLLC